MATEDMDVQEMATDEGVGGEESSVTEVEATAAEGEAGDATAAGEAEAEGEVATEIDARLLHAAERAGLSEEDIASLGGKVDGVLGKLADGFDAVSRDFAALGRRGREATPQVQEQVSEAQQEKPVGNVLKDFAEPLHLKLNDEEFGEGFAKSFEPVIERINKMQQAMLSGYEDIRKIDQWRRAQAEQQLEQAADMFFKSVEDKYGDVLGKGPGGKLDRNSPEFKARRAMLEEADTIYAGATLQGRQMDFQEAMQRALSLSMAGRQEQLARKEVTAKLKKRSNQIIARPTHRETKRAYKTDTQKAEEAVAQKLKALGVSVT